VCDRRRKKQKATFLDTMADVEASQNAFLSRTSDEEDVGSPGDSLDQSGSVDDSAMWSSVDWDEFASQVTLLAVIRQLRKAPAVVYCAFPHCAVRLASWKNEGGMHVASSCIHAEVERYIFMCKVLRCRSRRQQVRNRCENPAPGGSLCSPVPPPQSACSTVQRQRSFGSSCQHRNGLATEGLRSPMPSKSVPQGCTP